MCRGYFVGWGRCNMCNGSDIFSVMKAENLFKTSTAMFRWRIAFKGCMMCHRCCMVNHRCWFSNMMYRLYWMNLMFPQKVGMVSKC